MQAYGRKKSSTKAASHQECGTCHPIQKNKKKRARQAQQKEIELMQTSKPMMKCGHAANAVNTRTNTPSCAICAGLTLDADVVDESAPFLEGRIARCSYYGSIPSGRNHESNYGCKRGERCLCERASSTDLPFFHRRDSNDYDQFFCGCWGWD